MSETPRPARNERLLLTLLSEVQRTRALVREARVATSDFTSRQSLASARADCIVALEAYAAAATQGGVPVPQRFRDELRLFVSLQDDRHSAS